MVLPKTEWTMSDAAKRRRALEKAAAERKHVEERDVVGFTYRPTPPSAPSPDASESPVRQAKRKRKR